MMPQSSQNLYFHLGMNSDDDGFCEHFTIMRMTDSKPDDLKVLQAKSFVRVFDDRVLIITDWKENNYLRSDRYTPSKYLEIYKEELKLLVLDTTGIPKVDKMDTQVRLGKDRKELENAPPDGDIEELLNEKGKIQHDYQFVGLEVFEKTGAPANKKGECIRIAKKYPHFIDRSMSFCADYPNPEARWKMFLWKLNQLRKNVQVNK